MATITKIPFTTSSQRRRRNAQEEQPRIFQAIAETANTLHKVQTLPRLRLQAIVSFLIFVAFIAGVNAMLLFMESQIGLVGREVISLNSEMMIIRSDNENLMTQLSQLNSAKILRQRALEDGFELIDPTNVTYIYVPGFTGRQPIDLSEPVSTSSDTSLDSAYTESLLSVIIKTISQASAPLTDL